jgi:hypothetical protein
LRPTIATGVTDPAHFAYSTFATAARIRQSNLSTTLADLSARLDNARREHEAIAIALREIEPLETLESSAKQHFAPAVAGKIS